LGLEGLGGFVVELNSVHTKSGHDAHGGLEAFVVLEVVHLARLGHDPDVNAGCALHANESLEGIGVSLSNSTSLNTVGKGQVEGVVAVMLPDTLEMGLAGDLWGLLVGEHQVILLDNLGGEFCEGVPLLLESLTALGGGGVNAEVNCSVLVGAGERVKSLVLLTVVICGGDVATVSPPGAEGIKLGHFVVEETGAETLSEMVLSEPLEGVRLLTLTGVLNGSPLRLHVCHGVVPGVAGVGIDFPAVLFLGGCPVGYLEALEHGTGLSVETDVTDTLEEGLGMEVLSVDVMHDVGLLVEFIAINVLNAHTCFFGLLNVELVGHSEDVGVGELDGVGDVLLDAGAGVEDELNPAGAALVSNVVLHGTADLSLAEEGLVHELI